MPKNGCATQDDYNLCEYTGRLPELVAVPGFLTLGTQRAALGSLKDSVASFDTWTQFKCTAIPSLPVFAVKCISPSILQIKMVL